MSQVITMTTGTPGSNRTCHVLCFYTSLKTTNAIKTQDAVDVFLRDLTQAKRWVGKGVRKKNGKRVK